MHQDIENIIKKNFYKEFKGEIIESFRGVRHTDGSIEEPYDRNIDKEIQQIIPLIADEVLKVVVETYKEAINFAIDTVNEEGHYCIRPGAKEGILKLVDYKLHLSPNKENENNE